MAQQTIDVGSTAGDGTGDPLRSAFTKINENFTELYSGNFGNLHYTPNNPADYNGTITSVQQALDELAARLRALNG